MSIEDLAAQVHNVAFRKPPLGQRGYDDEDVDKFLDWLEGAVASGADAVTITGRIEQAHFGAPPIGRRGYRPEDVDRFLDSIVEAVARHRGDAASEGVGPGPAVTAAPPSRPSQSAIVEHKGGFLRRLFGG